MKRFCIHPLNVQIPGKEIFPSCHWCHWSLPVWHETSKRKLTMTVVLFSDETRIPTLKAWWRKYSVQKVTRTFCSMCRGSLGGRSGMHWAGTNWSGRTELVEVNQRMKMPTGMLEMFCKIMLCSIWFDWIGFMQKNLQEVGIQKLNCPARSPDLNPTEHVWDMLKRGIRRRSPAPRSLEELKVAT